MKGFKLKYWAIPIVLIIGLLVFFRSGAFSNEKAQPGNTAVYIKVSAAQYVNTVPQLMLNGNIEGQTSADISAKISGRIEQVMVVEGQQVKAGDPLVKLESVELANSVRTASDAVTKAQVNYDLALTDYNRYQKLYGQGAISQQQLDTALAKLKIAQADLSSASSSYSSAQQQYGYGVITAPVDGVVANVTATVGQVVSPGAALMVVQDINAVYAVVNIEQKDLALVKVGQKAEVTVDSYAGKVFEGTVDRMNPEAGMGNRMFKTKIKIDNADGALKAGMFAKVQLATGDAVQVMTVPQTAVIQKQGLYYVFVIEDGKAVRRQVEIGTVTGETIEIKAGIEPGVQVAVTNVSQLKDGEAVRIVE
ncbi:MAG: efflux RND transporter periplasmic adaptor subunit [Veillonellaceae bacterium]|jgi:membrane fusion protein (multidrug efflux system)|nr:efflux RND transporter periplasmic adaptor subunit [Veillonellaceae bacterium]